MDQDQVAEAILLIGYFNMLSRVARAFDYPPDVLHPFAPNASLPLLEGRR